MGDHRNKINKIERATAEKANGDAWLRRRGVDPAERRQPPIHMLAFVCRGCWHNHVEKHIYACRRGYWEPVEFWCWDCMPPDLKDGQ